MTREMEQGILTEYNTTKSVKSIVLKFNRTPITIYNLLKKHGIPIERAKVTERLTKEKIPDLISFYNKGNGIGMCACIFNTDRLTIKKIFKENNVYMRTKQESMKTHRKVREKFKVNEEFFDNPENWTEKQAWVFGWLASDGNNFSPRQTVSLKLMEIDKVILEKVKDLLSFEGSISYYKSCNNSKPKWGLSIMSEKLSKTLYNLGIVDRKSMIYVLPKFLRPDLIRHFLRGYFEGDGCITKMKDKNRWRATIIGTKIFLDELNLVINQETGILIKNVALRIQDINHKLYTGISADYAISNTKDLYKFYQYLYKDCTYFLPRKKEKFDQFVAHLMTKPEYTYLNPVIV